MLGPIQTRHRIKKYKEYLIEDEKLDEILYAALYSPSEHANRDWEVVKVTNQDTMDKLSLAAPDIDFVATAPIILVMCSHQWANWIEDVSTAAENIYLEALNQGLGANVIQLREHEAKDGVNSEEYVRTTLSIPDEIRIHSLLPLGYPDQASQELKEGIVFDKKKMHVETW